MARTISMLFEPIVPGPLRSKDISSPLTTAVFRTGRRMLSDFKKTVATWKVQPVFELNTKRSLDFAAVQVHTSNRIYAFLDQGTSVRHATMDYDFEPKSKVRVIGSFPGRGGRAFVSKFNYKRGITPREWSIVIENKYRRQFPIDVEEAMNKARIASGHAI